MRHDGRGLLETRCDQPSARRGRRTALGGTLLGLALLMLGACAGTTGAESAEALEEREAEATAEEKGNRRN